MKHTVFKKIAAFSAALVLGSCMVAGLSACSGSDNSGDAGEIKLIEEGKLIVGSDLDYKPMEFIEGDVAQGFGIDMITEICDRLGLECEVLPPQNFDTLVTQVASGTNMDVAVSSMTITDERLEVIDFSDPYFDSNLAMVVMADAPYATTSDLKGLSVGAQSGSSGEDWVFENLGKDNYTPYNGPTEGMAGLRSGKIEALVFDEPVAANMVSTEYTDCKVLEVIPTGEQYGIAVNKDNPALTAAINETLAEMQADGTMDALLEKWGFK